MSNPAILADVESRWRVLSAAEQTVAQTKLDDAWRLLRREVTDLETRIDADTTGDLAPEAARVLAEAVIRVMQNPEGHKAESRSIDDASKSWTLADSRASGELHFTDGELAGLREVADVRGKAFSIQPSFAVDTTA